LYIINSGIKATDRILLEGLRKVKDGDKVTYSYKAPQAVISNLKVYSE
jgi:membrane fusion protein, multidrug efflux system